MPIATQMQKNVDLNHAAMDSEYTMYEVLFGNTL